MSHFTTGEKSRKVSPYQWQGQARRPTHQATYFLERDGGAGPRPVTAATVEAPPRCRLTLTIDDRDYGVRVEFPGGAEHVVRLEGPMGDRCRVSLGADLYLIGTCFGWTEGEGCRHANAAYDAGLFPELALAAPKPTILVGGGEP